jgi:hypothetical protein
VGSGEAFCDCGFNVSFCGGKGVYDKIKRVLHNVN